MSEKGAIHAEIVLGLSSICLFTAEQIYVTLYSADQKVVANNSSDAPEKKYFNTPQKSFTPHESV
jgi:hypothetical protein